MTFWDLRQVVEAGENGSKMDQKWIKNGSKMDQKWIKNGSKEWREMSKKRTKKRSQQHPVFPGGHF